MRNLGNTFSPWPADVSTPSEEGERYKKATNKKKAEKGPCDFLPMRQNFSFFAFFFDTFSLFFLKGETECLFRSSSSDIFFGREIIPPQASKEKRSLNLLILPPPLHPFSAGIWSGSFELNSPRPLPAWRRDKAPDRQKKKIEKKFFFWNGRIWELQSHAVIPRKKEIPFSEKFSNFRFFFHCDRQFYNKMLKLCGGLKYFFEACR